MQFCELRLCVRRAIPAMGLALMALALGGCDFAVPLKYEPSRSNILISQNHSNTPLYIAPVLDERVDAEKKNVGVNKDNMSPIPVLLGKGKTPGEFVHEAFEKELRRSGYNVVATPDGARHTLRITITKFWVVETNEYNSDVAVRVDFLDGSGSSRWTVNLSGTDKTEGHSLRPDLYNQVLSNAITQIAGAVVVYPDFASGMN